MENEYHYWVARDKCGSLAIYLYKPYKAGFGNALFRWDSKSKPGVYDRTSWPLDSDMFPNVKWEDEEPLEVVIKPFEK